MDTPAPRFEFRTFMPDLGDLETVLHPFVTGVAWEESAETYLVSSTDEVHNVKLRDDQLDIKTLVNQEQGLEQWQPSFKASFPLSARSIRDDVWPAFNVPLLVLQRDSYTQDPFLAELIQPHPALMAVPLHKCRRRFDVHDCQAEHAEVQVQGKRLQTIAVESTSTEAVRAAKEKLGLDTCKNVNYVRAIKQILGVK